MLQKCISVPCNESHEAKFSKKDYRVVQREDPSVATDKEPSKPANIEKLPYALINTFIIIFTLSDQNRVVLLNQFLYHRLARDISGNVSVDTTSDPCGEEFGLSSSESDTSTVQQITSSMTMNFELVVSLLGILGSLVLGTFSTSMSRKAQLLIPITGCTIRAFSILAVAFWDLNLSWLYFGCVAEGLMGGSPGVYLGVFLYVSDITPRNRKRTLGLALLEGVRGIIGSGSNIASGMMIQHTPFVVPASFTASGAIICAVMACLMPNRMPMKSEDTSSQLVRRSENLSLEVGIQSRDSPSEVVKQSENLSSRPANQSGHVSEMTKKAASLSQGEVKLRKGNLASNTVRRSWRVLMSPFQRIKEQKLRRMVGVAAVAYFLGFSTNHSLDRVRLLYLMHRPFCWSAISIGWYQCVRQAIFNLAIITMVPLLHRYFPGVSLAVLGAVANITEYTLFAFANTNIYLYIALATSFGQGFPLNMVRGETSRLFGPEEQGLWFACLAVLESISFSVGIFLMSVYTMSLPFYTGLIFNVYAAMAITMIVFLCVFQYNWLNYMKLMFHNEKTVQDSKASIPVTPPKLEDTLSRREVVFPLQNVLLLRSEVTLPLSQEILPRREKAFHGPGSHPSQESD